LCPLRAWWFLQDHPWGGRKLFSRREKFSLTAAENCEIGFLKSRQGVVKLKEMGNHNALSSFYYWYYFYGAPVCLSLREG